LRLDNVASLTDSIKVLGLNTAISVVEVPPGQDGCPTYELVDGNHRLEAFKRLGRSAIPARVLELNSITRQLAEIDANLCRAELTALERSEHLLRRKELYEELHPETRQHVAGATAAHASMGRGTATDNLSVASFAVDTAAKTGVTDRSIRRDISRAKRIDPAVRDQIRDNPEVANNGSALDALASLTPDDQRRVADLIESKKCKSVAAAKRSLQHLGRPAVETPPKNAGFKTTRPAVPRVDIPKSKRDAATPDLGKQDDIRKLHEIVHRIEGTDRNNLIAYLNKLGSTRCDKVAECLQ
jgi:ParB-like chromosome segregation protein Spo0J